MNLPQQVISLLPPTIIHASQRYAVFGSAVGMEGWFVIDESITLDDLYKIWVRWSPSKVETKKTPNNVWSVEASKPGKFYKVRLINEVWSCECSGFGFRRDCRHIKEIKAKI